MNGGTTVNMHTVAERAGVSTATVSRVLSGSPGVGPATAARVRKIIEELNFVPNASATALKYGRSDTYGLVIANVINPFFLEFLRDFDNLLAGKQGILLTNAENPERINASIQLLLRNQVDGVIMMTQDEELGAHYDRFSLRNIPMVTIDRREVKPLISDVSFRYEQGMRGAVEHLAELGHRHIAFIGGTRGLKSSKMRRAAFVAALRRTKVQIRQEWLVEGNYLRDGGERETLRLLQLDERPTAIVTVNDMTALGAISAVHSLGMSVPDDISIVGVDDIMLGTVMTPTLTTVRLPRKRVAQACIDCFSYMTKHPKENGLQLQVETELIIRTSSGPVNGGATRG